MKNLILCFLVVLSTYFPPQAFAQKTPEGMVLIEPAKMVLHHIVKLSRKNSVFKYFFNLPVDHVEVFTEQVLALHKSTLLYVLNDAYADEGSYRLVPDQIH